MSDKAANGNMVVVDKFACDEYKTKTVVAMLNAVGAGKKLSLIHILPARHSRSLLRAATRRRTARRCR